MSERERGERAREGFNLKYLVFKDVIIYKHLQNMAD